MGLLRFSRKDKPSATTSTTTSSVSTSGRFEIPSPVSSNKDTSRQQKTVSRDFFSNSAFRAIIGERGSLMDDIYSELQFDLQGSSRKPIIPCSSASTSTAAFENTKPTLVASKSAALPRHRINRSNSNNTSSQGFLEQNYMEANSRRQQLHHNHANPGSSNNRMTPAAPPQPFARPDVWDVDHQTRRKSKQHYYNFQSDILPPPVSQRMQKKEKHQASRRSRSVPGSGRQIPVINEPTTASAEPSAQRQQQHKQPMQNCATQKCDLLQPGNALHVHLPPTPPPDAEEEDEEATTNHGHHGNSNCHCRNNHHYDNHHHHHCHQHSNDNCHHQPPTTPSSCPHSHHNHHHCTANHHHHPTMDSYSPCMAHHTCPNRPLQQPYHNQHHCQHYNHCIHHNHCMHNHHHHHHYHHHHHCCCNVYSPPPPPCHPCHHHQTQHNHQGPQHHDVRRSASAVVLPSHSNPALKPSSMTTRKGKYRVVQNENSNNAGHCCNKNKNTQ
ncbi:hypothetical protein BDB00DRAFT_794054 [Zychaea mexicana]|uniref:uncharacterized protein n=1 Tax=Zychaea mexicana TaxID=64656 RepID=UPI0022FF37F0|nr:uncharacterized protein BDB00DRAFT_794054 [Zychaea mexicana]KAI9499462.1 hypothetical protein BDB00DRAFT_794054 [Zychaea mexicana]